MKKLLLGIVSGIILLNMPMLIHAAENSAVFTFSGGGTGKSWDASDSGDSYVSSDNVYEAGMYKIGTDMPPGEYVLMALDDHEGYFRISTDANQDDLIHFDFFDYDAIVTVSSGQYLDIDNSYAVPFDDIESLDLTEEGMFEIGIHLAAGEYKLIADENAICSYYIYNDNLDWNISNMKMFDNDTYVEVENGQYLQLLNCHIENPVAPGEEDSIPRTKANTGIEFNSNCVIDELGWVEDVSYTGESLKTFYDMTGVQPFVYFKAYDESIITDEDKEAYAEAWYDQNIGNEGTFLYIYFAEEDSSNDIGYMYCVDGYDIETVMDSEAIETFWDYVNEYWYDGDLSTEDFLIDVFDSTAKEIMQ